MRYSKSIKPVSYLKSNTAKIIAQLNSDKETMIITQNGEAKLAIQDIESYEKLQETLSMLKILAIGNAEVENGEIVSLEEAFQSLKKKK